ncbi:MAG TPA: DUF4345 family protein [Methylomirabilota bacterium]|nr:DUF4345 family protein [Methylomirabilota bacterium]
MIARGRLARWTLVLAGFLFLVVGILMLMDPRLLQGLGFRLESPIAVSEVRATYGGMHVFVGLLLLVGAFAVRIRDAALLILATYTVGVVVGRVVGFVVDGWPGPLVALFLAPEALAAVLATLLLIVRRSP